MLTAKTTTAAGAASAARKGFFALVADALYEAIVRRALRSIHSDPSAA